MSLLNDLLVSQNLVTPSDTSSASGLSARLGRRSGLKIYPASIAVMDGRLYCLGGEGVEKFICLAVGGEFPGSWTELVVRKTEPDADGITIGICRVNCESVAQLMAELDFLRPAPVGLVASFGFGDRLGLATPGHVRAVRGSGLAPFFPQQSIREMSRTCRSPRDVMTDAVIGVFETGYRDGFGADADHLKNTDDADACIKAGFTMFTVDPGDFVDDQADSDTTEVLAEKFEQLPWDGLQSTPADCRTTFVGRTMRLPDDLSVTFTEEVVMRAAVKYGRAVRHVVKMFRHIAGEFSAEDFELEVSVDETAKPTSVAEHLYVAMELRRLNVRWISLAPRFVGEFEKGVDYKGNPAEFERTFAGHVAVAKHVGPYKLSLHSGSDKFSIYPVVAKLAGELVHVKTAGTSYLEALRVVAQVEPELFRRILDFAHQRYGEDKATYHVSADPEKVPAGDEPSNGELVKLLDQFDARQMLHVTYGSVLLADEGGRFRDRLLKVLRDNEELYAETLLTHLGRHVRPFTRE